MTQNPKKVADFRRNTPLKTADFRRMKMFCVITETEKRLIKEYRTKILRINMQKL